MMMRTTNWSEVRNPIQFPFHFTPKSCRLDLCKIPYYAFWVASFNRKRWGSEALPFISVSYPLGCKASSRSHYVSWRPCNRKVLSCYHVLLPMKVYEKHVLLDIILTYSLEVDTLMSASFPLRCFWSSISLKRDSQNGLSCPWIFLETDLKANMHIHTLILSLRPPKKSLSMFRVMSFRLLYHP